MKYFLIFLLLNGIAYGQKLTVRNAANSYILTLKTNSEKGVINYKVQQSNNNRNWNTIGSPFLPKFLPDSNTYVITLPTPQFSRYYRVVAMMHTSNYITKAIYVKVSR